MAVARWVLRPPGWRLRGWCERVEMKSPPTSLVDMDGQVCGYRVTRFAVTTMIMTISSRPERNGPSSTYAARTAQNTIPTDHKMS